MQDNSTPRYHHSEKASRNKWISRDLQSFSFKVSSGYKKKTRRACKIVGKELGCTKRCGIVQEQRTAVLTSIIIQWEV